MLVDCGIGSSVLISNTDTVNIGGFRIDGLDFLLTPAQTIVVPCSGIVDVITQPTVNAKIFHNPMTLFSDTFLLGLAGIVCAGLIVYAINKYAI